MKYKTYKKYKLSGIEWLGEIPDEWELNKLRNICYMKGRIGWQGLKQSEFRDEGPYLITGMDFKNDYIEWDSCYHISEERYNQAPEIQLKNEDVLMTKDGTIGKLLHIKNLPGKASLNSHLLVLRPLRNAFINRFLYYALSSNYFLIHIDLTKTGTTFYGISQESTGEFKITLPPLSEQKAIADFLDRETAKIDTLISHQEKLIELLQEKRQALISHAVTKGIPGKYRKMKQSGVEWLGEIPEEWEVKKIKRIILKIGSGITPTGGSMIYTDTGIPFLRSQNIYNDGIRVDDIVYISNEVHNKMSRSKVFPLDVLLNIVLVQR